MIHVLNVMKKISFELHECFMIEMSAQLISIPCFDNKSRTISIWPSETAAINGVVWNVWNKSQK